MSRLLSFLGYYLVDKYIFSIKPLRKAKSRKQISHKDWTIKKHKNRKNTNNKNKKGGGRPNLKQIQEMTMPHTPITSIAPQKTTTTTSTLSHFEGLNWQQVHDLPTKAVSVPSRDSDGGQTANRLISQHPRRPSVVLLFH